MWSDIQKALRQTEEEQDLHGVDFSDADLSRARLRGPNLSGADLNGANLNHAYLNDADLNGADSIRAILHNARLLTSDLNGAITHNAQFGEGMGLSDLEQYSLVRHGANFNNVFDDRTND